jgi:hypothetical protein
MINKERSSPQGGSSFVGMRAAFCPSTVLFLTAIPSPLFCFLANLPGQLQEFFAAAFFLILVRVLFIRTLGGFYRVS